MIAEITTGGIVLKLMTGTEEEPAKSYPIKIKMSNQ